MIRATIIVVMIAAISGCSLVHITPQQPPPPGPQAQEITRAQRFNLKQLGSYSVMVAGSPDDASRAVAAEATARGAAYYLIIMIDETSRPGVWIARSIFYGPPAAVHLPDK